MTFLKTNNSLINGKVSNFYKINKFNMNICLKLYFLVFKELWIIILFYFVLIHIRISDDITKITY